MKLNKTDIMILDKSASEYKEKYGNALYHYTSIDAFFGMITNGEFWWGNTAAMNDKSELTYFITKLRNALRKEAKSTKEADTTKKILASLFDQINERVKSEYPFAMSFSTLPDDAAQWERYANNATGVRIAFNTEALVEIFRYHDIALSGMFYKYNIKDDEYYRILKEYLKNSKIDEFENINEVIDSIIICAALHKHESFSSEKEVRLFTLPKVYEKNLVHHYAKISYELLNRQIKETLKINFAQLCEKIKINEGNLFSEIMLGPRSVQNFSNLEKFCKENKLETKIMISKCPLR